MPARDHVLLTDAERAGLFGSPEDELARVMDGIRAMACPLQRAALLTLRWSGARRSEVRRLALDCLDRYPDGTVRLRIPVGKTGRERMVPLHEEAADALRAVTEARRGVRDRAMVDERTGDRLGFLFVDHDRLLSEYYLFETPLGEAWRAVGLVDAHGRHTVTAHRFRHTLGTQLAERGARLDTIMSVLGHESPAMSMVYARISDPEVLRDYRAVLRPGAVIAGSGAEAVRTGRLTAGAVDWLRANFLKPSSSSATACACPRKARASATSISPALGSSPRRPTRRGCASAAR